MILKVQYPPGYKQKPRRISPGFWFDLGGLVFALGLFFAVWLWV